MSSFLKRSLAFTSLPLFLAIGLYIYRKHHPVELPTLADTNETCKSLQRKWQEGAFTSISSLAEMNEGLGKLTISPASAEDKRGITEAVSLVISSLKAKTFAEYYQARSGGKSFSIMPEVTTGQASYIERTLKGEGFKHTKNVPIPLPSDSKSIYEIVWTEMTKNGSTSLAWAGIDWDSSWVACADITQEKFLFSDEFLDSIPKAAENCGLISTMSSFVYFPSPQDVMKENGKLRTAVAYILFKTNDQIAYPIMFQFYRLPSRNEWLPINLAVGYLGKRPPDPYF